MQYSRPENSVSSAAYNFRTKFKPDYHGVKWNAPKLQSVFSKHIFVSPRKRSLGEKKMHDGLSKAGGNAKASKPGSRCFGE